MHTVFILKIKFIHFIDKQQLTEECVSTYVWFVTICKRVNAYQSYHCEESCCLGHIDLNEMCELQVTVTSHSQITVTLV